MPDVTPTDSSGNPSGTAVSQSAIDYFNQQQAAAAAQDAAIAAAAKAKLDALLAAAAAAHTKAQAETDAYNAAAAAAQQAQDATNAAFYASPAGQAWLATQPGGTGGAAATNPNDGFSLGKDTSQGMQDFTANIRTQEALVAAQNAQAQAVAARVAANTDPANQEIARLARVAQNTADQLAAIAQTAALNTPDQIAARQAASAAAANPSAADVGLTQSTNPSSAPPADSQTAPGATLFQYFLANPTAPTNAIDALNKLVALQVQIVPVGNVSLRKQSLIWSDTNVLLPIPIGLPLGYAAPTGTLSRVTFNSDETTAISATPTQAQVQAVQARLTATRQILAALIADFQQTGLIGVTG